MVNKTRAPSKGMSTADPPADVIFLFNRAALRNVLRDEFKSVGTSNFHIADNTQRLAQMVAQHTDAFLVIDWDIGALDVTRALQIASPVASPSFRPILLIAPDMDVQVLGVAAEYNVSRVHTGEVTRARIQQHIAHLCSERDAVEPLRAALTEAAEARIVGDSNRATRVLAKLHAKFPKSNRITADYAESLMLADKWDEAGVIAKSLSDVEPAYTRGLHLYGRFLMRMRRFSEACEVFKRAKLLNPFNLERLLALGHALLQIDKVSEARQQFESVLKIQRGRKEALQGVGECMLVEGDVNEALLMLKEVSSPRELASIFNSAAVLSMRQGRFETGRTLYHVAMNAVTAQPRLLARLVFNLGIGYHRWQKPEDALDCFRRAVALDQDYPDARFNAGVLARKLGEDLNRSETAAVATEEEIYGEAGPFKGDFEEDLPKAAGAEDDEASAIEEESIRNDAPSSKTKSNKRDSRRAS